MRIFLAGLLLGLIMSLGADAAERLLSPFEGSRHLGSFQARFLEMPLLASPVNKRGVASVQTIAGELSSQAYQYPEGVAPLEVYRSNLEALRSGGFEIVLACSPPECNAKRSIGKVIRPTFKPRDYGRTGVPSMKDYLLGWAEFYISAKKALPDRDVFVAVYVSTQRRLYAVDVLQTSEMRADTVTLSEAVLARRLEDTGRSVLDGVYFEVGSDRITADSAAALDVIARYLGAHDDERYYVVGHTDDTGQLAANLALSRARAEAVADALAARGVDPDRLTAEGVGPYSPLANNRSEAGKAMNRRVELVRRLP